LRLLRPRRRRRTNPELAAQLHAERRAAEVKMDQYAPHRSRADGVFDIWTGL
jgi:hypothetical protein